MVPNGDADARAPPIPLKPLRLHSKRAEMQAEKRSNAHFPCRDATQRLLVVLICRARLCGSLAGVSASRICRRCLANCKCADISFGECKWRDVSRAGMSFGSSPPDAVFVGRRGALQLNPSVYGAREQRIQHNAIRKWLKNFPRIKKMRRAKNCLCLTFSVVWALFSRSLLGETGLGAQPTRVLFVQRK